MSSSPYEDFFINQMSGGGDGGGDCIRIGRASIGYNQSGAGIGSYLKGLFRRAIPHVKRRALPVVKRGVKAVGKEALDTGVNIINDVVNQNRPIKEAIKERTREGGEKLKRKAEKALDKLMVGGSGYKRKRKSHNSQLRGTPGSGNISLTKEAKGSKVNKTKKHCRQARDIFEK
jgi:hypothetical protein